MVKTTREVVNVEEKKLQIIHMVPGHRMMILITRKLVNVARHKPKHMTATLVQYAVGLILKITGFIYNNLYTYFYYEKPREKSRGFFVCDKAVILLLLR